MGQALAASYQAHHDKIKKTGSVWQKHGLTGKWYHTYDKAIVKCVLASLESEIRHNTSDASNSLYHWAPVT